MPLGKGAQDRRGDRKGALGQAGLSIALLVALALLALSLLAEPAPGPYEEPKCPVDME